MLEVNTLTSENHGWIKAMKNATLSMQDRAEFEVRKLPTAVTSIVMEAILCFLKTHLQIFTFYLFMNTYKICKTHKNNYIFQYHYLVDFNNFCIFKI